MKTLLNFRSHTIPFFLFHRRLLTLLLFSTLLSSNAFAQAYSIPCSKLGIEAIPIESPNCAGSNKCGKQYFQVRLATNGFTTPPPNVNSFKLIYYKLGVSALLDITSPASGGLSRINAALTEVCYSSGPFSSFSELSVESTDNGEILSLDFTNDVVNNVSGPEIVFTKVPLLNGGYTWHCNLFVVAIDAFPGETISVISQEAYYVNLPPGNIGIISCAQLNPISTADPITIEAPDNESDVCLEFGNYNTSTHLIPVVAENNTANSKAINQLLFSFTIDASNLMEPPALVNLPGNMTGILEPIPNSMDWQGRIFYNPSSGSFSVPANSSSTLFNIRLVGPVNSSQAASAVFAFGTAGTIRTTTGGGGASECDKVCIGANATVSFSGYEACSPSDFTFKITGIDPINNTNSEEVCSNLQVEVELKWNFALDNNLLFDQVRFAAVFDLPDGITIESVNNNEFTCPANPQCLPVSGYSNCFSIVGNKVSFCYFPGTPHTISNGTSFTINFAVTEGCITGLAVTEAFIDLAGSSACVPNISMEGFPLCTPRLSGAVFDELNQPAPNLNVQVFNSECNTQLIDVHDGYFSHCACKLDEGYTIMPIPKNNDWLNGVTTYDLLLISKHILGLQLLDSPNKIIAADANKSGSVNTFDVTEFRKLILGIYNELPNNDSWRYINADHVFPDPTNPFQTSFPEKWAGGAPASDIDFIAVKIGDVNNSHTPDDIIGMPRPAVQPVGIGKPSQRAGEYITIPVSYEGSEAIAAIQLGLRFDADNWELLEPSTADLPDYEPGCFNLREAAEGRIKFLWFTPWPKEQLQQGRTLFYLTFRNKKGDTEAIPTLYTDDKILESIGFAAAGQTYTLAVKELPAARSAASAVASLNWSVDCAPNPVADALILHIDSPQQQAISVWVFNALGVRTYYREMVVQAGTTQVTIPEVAGWPAGIYTWKVKSGKEKRQGQFVRR